eukprot:c31065_g1_i1 orf=87-284(+)
MCNVRGFNGFYLDNERLFATNESLDSIVYNTSATVVMLCLHTFDITPPPCSFCNDDVSYLCRPLP